MVVVAVDSRWLLRSLKGTFSEAFDDKRRAPTPQNYLEKIIQIPFWLRPMHRDGFERLITTLAGDVQGGPDHRTAQVGNEPDSGSMPLVWSARETDRPSDVEGRRDGEGGDIHAASAMRSAETETIEEDVKAPTQNDLNPQPLQLTSEERDFMLTFMPLVGTPRAAKRFLNTYQLLRVSVPDVETFLSRQEYQPVLILLALMTGTAPMTDKMVEELQSMRESTFERFLESREQAGWQEIASACEKLPTATLSPGVLAVWLPQVARYTFHPVKG